MIRPVLLPLSALALFVLALLWTAESWAQSVRISSEGDCPDLAMLTDALSELGVSIDGDADVELSVISDNTSAAITIVVPGQDAKTRTIAGSDCRAIAEMFSIIGTNAIAEMSLQSPTVVSEEPDSAVPLSDARAFVGIGFATFSIDHSTEPQEVVAPEYVLSISAVVGISSSQSFSTSPVFTLLDLSIERSTVALSASLWINQATSVGQELDSRYGGAALEVGYPIRTGHLWIQPMLGVGVQASKISSPISTRNSPLRLHPTFVASLSGRIAITRQLVLRTDIRLLALPLVDRYLGADGVLGESPRIISMVGVGLQWATN